MNRECSFKSGLILIIKSRMIFFRQGLMMAIFWDFGIVAFDNERFTL